LAYKKRFGRRTVRRNNFQKNSCNRPNRLNLLHSTVCSGARSNFFTKNSYLALAPDTRVIMHH
jgi:hypothetical protein